MNLFFLSWNIIKCARYHGDKHVVKLILELAQMLYAAHHVLQKDDSWKSQTKPYRLSFKNHPMSIWARSFPANYNYMALLALQLCKEYTKRYEEIHATQNQIEWLVANNIVNGKDEGKVMTKVKPKKLKSRKMKKPRLEMKKSLA